jgi:hypothetical protein
MPFQFNFEIEKQTIKENGTWLAVCLNLLLAASPNLLFTRKKTGFCLAPGLTVHSSFPNRSRPIRSTPIYSVPPLVQIVEEKDIGKINTSKTICGLAKGITHL